MGSSKNSFLKLTTKMDREATNKLSFGNNALNGYTLDNQSSTRGRAPPGGYSSDIFGLGDITAKKEAPKVEEKQQQQNQETDLSRSDERAANKRKSTHSARPF